MPFICALILLLAAALAAQQAAPPQQPAFEEWIDNFDGTALNEEAWERYTMGGGGGGKITVEKGELHMRGATGTRTGVRTRQRFVSERFIVEGKIAKVGERFPDPGSNDTVGNAIVTVLFGGSDNHRIEWILRSDGLFEAWIIQQDRPGERVDNRKLGTKEKTPTLGVARRGDEIFFMLNGEVGLQRTLPGLPRDFKVMLYGYGSSENNWDSVRVVAAK